MINDKDNKNYFKKDKINYDEKYFFNLNKNIFNFFDEIESENIHRVYPHKIFVIKNAFIMIKEYFFLMRFIPQNMEVL